MAGGSVFIDAVRLYLLQILQSSFRALLFYFTIIVLQTLRLDYYLVIHNIIVYRLTM